MPIERGLAGMGFHDFGLAERDGKGDISGRVRQSAFAQGYLFFGIPRFPERESKALRAGASLHVLGSSTARSRSRMLGRRNRMISSAHCSAAFAFIIDSVALPDLCGAV